MSKEKKIPEQEAQTEKDTAPAKETITEESPPGTNEAELARLTEENGQLNDRLLRLMAEFDNFKKRTAREKEEISDFGKALCIKEMLLVADNFERALDCETQDAEFKKGIEMTFSQLTEALKRLGVEEIPALNESFNPDVHNAVNRVEDESFGENTVCQVFQKGYRMNGKTIRPAMVAVANP